jgi:uncharacterized membrane protein YdjX (TVP38/TMEM64 family)
VRAARLALGGALASLCLAGCAFALLCPRQALAVSEGFVETARGAGGAGALLFGLAQVLVALSGVLPAALLGVAAGAVYGVGFGFALAAVSTIAGAWLAFSAARAFLREYALRLVARRPIVREFDAAIARGGWRFVCLVRLSPVMPFSATSFALGLTGVGARDYLAGTLASLPALFGYVLMGALTQNGLSQWAQGAGLLRLGVLALGLAATAVLTLRLGRVARAAYSFSQY